MYISFLSHLDPTTTINTTAPPPSPPHLHHYHHLLHHQTPLSPLANRTSTTIITFSTVNHHCTTCNYESNHYKQSRPPPKSPNMSETTLDVTELGKTEACNFFSTHRRVMRRRKVGSTFRSGRQTPILPLNLQIWSERRKGS
ncbi:hypothetical protein HanRHA438_Chr03g0109581 [Helianthus annuus]|nr:hypothetical protein HanRHA438_Chr03g0109581 [Helianthus annuus]